MIYPIDTVHTQFILYNWYVLENRWRLTSTLAPCIIRNLSTWFWTKCMPEPEAPEPFWPGKVSIFKIVLPFKKIIVHTYDVIRPSPMLCVSWWQAANRGSLQRRRFAAGRDGAWLSDRLRSQHVAAGATHDFQWRLWGGCVRTVRPVGILRVVSRTSGLTCIISLSKEECAWISTEKIIIKKNRNQMQN